MCKLTVQQLINAGACAPQLERFRFLFGTEVRVTEQTARTFAHTFSWNWAADELLSPRAASAFRSSAHDAWLLWVNLEPGARGALRYAQTLATAWAREYIKDGES